MSPEAVSHATSLSESWLGAKLVDIIHQFQLRGGQLLNPVNVISKKPGRSKTKRAYFISDHGKELSILVGRGRGCHDRVLYSVVSLMASQRWNCMKLG